VLVIARGVSPGYRSTARYSHYSLLRTIEDSWALAPLTGNDAAATPLTDFFSSGSVNAASIEQTPPLPDTERGGGQAT